MIEVNEGSTSYVTATFLDKDGGATTPLTVAYEVYCRTTGTQIRTSTGVAAASSVEITLDSTTDNVFVTPTNKFEVRRVIITASYSATDKAVGSYDYRIVNLDIKE